MLDYLLLDTLSVPECEEIVSELRTIVGSAAPVYGTQPSAKVDPSMRKANCLTPSDATRNRVMGRIREQTEAIEKNFGFRIGKFEEPQFLRYVAGDYFVAHQDGNTPLTLDDSRFRRISIVVFLNSQYAGGSLVLHGRYPDLMLRTAIPARPGSMVVFRSETTHEVTPVESGERYSIVSWCPAA